MTTTANADPAPSRDVTLTRVFDAPRDLVFRMWIEPKHMAEWWGPKGFTNPVCEMDVRPGGKLRIHMRAPDGVVYPMSGTFREVALPSRLVFTTIPEDDDGNPLLEGHTVVTFEAQGERTKVTVQSRGVGLAPVAAKMLAGMQMGWSQSLERLAELVTRVAAR